MPDFIAQWIETHDAEDFCPYCIYHGCCPGPGVTGSPNGPVFPPCSDQDPEQFLDLELLESAILDDME